MSSGLNLFQSSPFYEWTHPVRISSKALDVVMDELESLDLVQDAVVADSVPFLTSRHQETQGAFKRVSDKSKASSSHQYSV